MATLKGVWVFNELTYENYDGFGDVSVNFISNGENFVGMTHGVQPIEYVRSDGGTVGVLIAHTSWYWADKAYRTVDFGETEQTVGGAFYAWFTANATPKIETYAIKAETLEGIASAIREKLNTTNKINPTEMPQAIRDISGGDDDGSYDQGYADGQTAEYKRFWDICQDNGTRTNYYYGFAYTSWMDGCFNPKYTITCKSASASAQAVFYNNTYITEIPCEVHIIGIVARNTFYGCKNLKSIALLYLEGDVSFSNTFSGCSALENLTVSGSISSSIDLSASSVLSNASVQSIIGCLETVSSQQTLTLHASVGANVTAEQKAAITAKNWELVY